MKAKFFKKIPKTFYTIFSLSAAAAINYTLIHSPIVLIFLLVLLAHELGHYFMAKKYKADVAFPIFIPLPFIVIGITKVCQVSLEAQKDIAMYGPIVGFITAILFLLLNFIFKMFPVSQLALVALGEVIFNYFGNDGSKYRKAKRSMSKCIF